LKPGKFPRLEGWLTLPEAAEKLGMSRQRVHQICDKGGFTTAHEIGTFIVVRAAEVNKMLAARQAEAARLEEAAGQEEATEKLRVSPQRARHIAAWQAMQEEAAGQEEQ
jgi:predicted DNA-binding transcriptional regulator AlpA